MTCTHAAHVYPHGQHKPCQCLKFLREPYPTYTPIRVPEPAHRDQDSPLITARMAQHP